jgi:hypothetical protein
MRQGHILRWFGSALAWGAGAVLLSASQCTTPIPPPVPGQPLTWAQQHQIDLQEAQDEHLNRRQNDGCAPNCRRHHMH